MSKNKKHTPTPWMPGPSDGGGISTVDAVDPKDGQLFIVCEVYGINDSRTSCPESAANAEFIVRACNAHDLLVSALKQAKDFEQHAGGTHLPAGAWFRLHEAIDAALTAAGAA